MAMIDFSSVIRDLFGRPCLDAGDAADKEAARKELTLATVAATALTAVIPDEHGLAGNVKVERFAVAMKVAQGGPVDLKAEEIAILKELIGKLYAPLVVGRAWEILDPPPKE